MSEKQFDDFLSSFFTCVFSVLRPGAPIYVAHADGKPGLSFRRAFNGAGFYFSGCLIWRKNQATLGRSDYQYQHEPILYGWKPGAPHSWYGGRKRRSVVDVNGVEALTRIDDKTIHINVDNETYVITGSKLAVSSFFPSIISIDKPLRSEAHPTMKPVALVEHFLINSSREGDVIWDPFGGSGTTLMACEIRGRKARLIELEECFADVIISRWQDYTGAEATLSDGRSFSQVLEERGQRAKEN